MGNAAKEEEIIVIFVVILMLRQMFLVTMVVAYIESLNQLGLKRKARTQKYSLINHVSNQINHLERIVQATGVDASDFEKLASWSQSHNVSNNNDSNISMDYEGETEPISQSLQDTATSRQRKGKRKRKERESIQEYIVSALNEFNEKTKLILDALLLKVGHQVDLSSKRKGVNGALKNIGWLGVEDRIKVGFYLVKSPGELEHFYSFTEEDRGGLVRMILNEKFR